MLVETLAEGLTEDTVDSAVSSTFKTTYEYDPVAFVHDCFTWKPDQGPTFYQEEVLSGLVERKRACVRGPHGLGKTALMSWIILWFSLTRDGDDWKIPTTASAWRQLSKFLWPEIHKWSRALRWDLIGRKPFNLRTELLQLNLKLRTGEAFAAASDNPALIEGAHADRLLYVFDESKAIIPDTFDAAEGAFSNAGGDTGGEALAVAFSTPGEPQGRFYDIQARKPGYEDWWVRAVTLEETIRAKRVSAEWAEQRKRQWGEKSAVYLNRVKGEFAASDEDGVIPLSHVEAANRRWEEHVDGLLDLFDRKYDSLDEIRAAGLLEGLTAVGVDVAWTGSNKTVFAPRYGKWVDELRYYTKEDPMQVAGRVSGVLQDDAYAVVDVIGIGGGVVSRLREMDRPVVAFNAAERSTARDRTGELEFANKRSEAWWRLRELLDPVYGENIMLPPDDTLTGDLTAPHWRVLSGVRGRIQVESKKDISERIGRSTDAGDAVMQCFEAQDSGEVSDEVLAMIYD